MKLSFLHKYSLNNNICVRFLKPPFSCTVSTCEKYVFRYYVFTFKMCTCKKLFLQIAHIVAVDNFVVKACLHAQNVSLGHYCSADSLDLLIMGVEKAWLKNILS